MLSRRSRKTVSLFPNFPDDKNHQGYLFKRQNLSSLLKPEPKFPRTSKSPKWLFSSESL